VNERGRRVVVVGAGIAGTAAALAASRSRATVTVLDGGTGASTLATGALDLAPWRPAADTTPALPPAARDVLDALGAHVLTDRGARLLTTAGVWRPAGGRDAALLDVAPFAGRPLGVVRCARPAWDADLLARAWGEPCVPIDASVLRYEDERAIPDADFAGRHDDAARLGWLAERLREALAKGSAGPALAALVLPPSLGVDRTRAAELSLRVGLACGEPLALPGGPSVLRFERARDRALAASGIERVQARARRVEPAEARADAPTWRVTTDDGLSLEADAVVLATGGLLGGGVEYAPSEAILATALPPWSRPPMRATLDAPVSLGARGRPLEVPGSLFGLAPEQIAWPFSPDGLLERAGVLVGDDGACVGTPRGLFAAGELVADAPHTWLCALIRGASAGVSAARSSGEPSPARGPASRP
jgi:glycerol-3-phosphate dehydrogenase subunit B